MTVQEKIMDAISTKVSPALQSHGGDVSFVSFDEESGTLYVDLVGSLCAGDPSHDCRSRDKTGRA